MTRNCLLIGGEGIDAGAIPEGFTRVGSDWFSLVLASRNYTLDQYSTVVFWPDRHTFDIAPGPEMLDNARSELEAQGLPVPPNLSWEALHKALERPNWTRNCPFWGLWASLQESCHTVLEPLISRLFRGGPPVLLVYGNETVGAEARGRWSWPTPHLEIWRTPEREKPTSVVGDHPVVGLFNSLLGCFESWRVAFDAIMRFDEVPPHAGGLDVALMDKSLVGRSVPWEILCVDPSRMDERTNLEEWISECYTQQNEYVEITGLRGGGSGLCRAILFKAGYTGILAISEPTDVRKFLDEITVFNGCVASDYTIRPSRDKNRLDVLYRGELLGDVGSKTKAAEVIRHCIRKGVGVYVSLDEINCLEEKYSQACQLRINVFKSVKPLYDALFEKQTTKKSDQIALRPEPASQQTPSESPGQSVRPPSSI